MSFVLAILLEFLAGAAAQWTRNRLRLLWPPAATVADDDEPVLDFLDVRDDVERIADLLDAGEADEAREECARLRDLMHGIDEARRADRRWQEMMIKRCATALPAGARNACLEGQPT